MIYSLLIGSVNADRVVSVSKALLLEDLSHSPCVVSCDGWRRWLFLCAMITSA
jgi:hypothetical protein